MRKQQSIGYVQLPENCRNKYNKIGIRSKNYTKGKHIQAKNQKELDKETKNKTEKNVGNLEITHPHILRIQRCNHQLHTIHNYQPNLSRKPVFISPTAAKRTYDHTPLYRGRGTTLMTHDPVTHIIYVTF